MARKELDLRVVRADLDKQLEREESMFFQGMLILATAMVTSQALANGKTADEGAALMAKMYEQMQDWFSGTSMKEQIKGLMETLLPDKYY